MPTYEYVCDKCAYRFERFQSMTDEPVKRCPKCKGKVRRVFAPGAGIIFKGSGFYQTDYRSPSYHAAAKKEKEGGAEKTAKTEPKKSDTGAAKKSD